MMHQRVAIGLVIAPIQLHFLVLVFLQPRKLDEPTREKKK
jgi:hypothetical protein